MSEHLSWYSTIDSLTIKTNVIIVLRMQMQCCLALYGSSFRVKMFLAHVIQYKNKRQGYQSIIKAIEEIIFFHLP